MLKTAALLIPLALASPTASQALPVSSVAPPPPAATVREYQKEFTTYPFSDPNPIPVVGRIYPYFRFDGFTRTAEKKRWKVIELENAFIRVQILPEIGGKIWNAVEKRTGRSFIYNNEVVKFRDVAMRGPWTSGGIEANYGIIGHTPNVATPVDYTTRTNPDGSVSCIIGALDLLTRTPWRLEVRLGAQDAAFSTTSFWYNASPLEQPYYSWMNAGIPVQGKLQFIYPGTSYLGHNGEHGPWPIDATGRDLSWYDRNNFGGYKSYHVFGRATDFVGAYWHEPDFGMVRYGTRDDKAGKKLWIWGLSRQGMIWEDLLTDSNGQYAEVQSGRLFNQSAEQSSYSPFKHRGFAPHTADRWTEYWYPVVGTKGFVAASRVGALNVTPLGDRIVVTLSPTVALNDSLIVRIGARLLASRLVTRAPLALYVDTIALPGVTAAARDSLQITLGSDLLRYEAAANAGQLARPLDAPAGFDWQSANGLYLKGKEWLRQREYAAARIALDSALLKDPHHLQALADRAMLALRAGEYDAARKFTTTALSVDSYDAAANYNYGLANRALGRLADAKDGFEIATLSPEYRGAAWTELARMAATATQWRAADAYVSKALTADAGNLDALGMGVLIARRTGTARTRDSLLTQLERIDPLSHQGRLERLLATDSSASALASPLRAGVRSELPEQTLLELALWYLSAGDTTTARTVASAGGDQPELLLLQVTLVPPAARQPLIDRAVALSPAMVFPFRPELVPALQQAVNMSASWKPRFYLALTWWSIGRLAAADSLLTAVGTQPDYAPFYAARAAFPARHPALARTDLQHAAELDSTEWRYGKLLADHALSFGDARSAVSVADRYAKRFPGNSVLGLTLARGEIAAGMYHEADALLATLTVLPNEGAKDGHTLYREAKLGLAREAIAAGAWSQADQHITDARKWPEQLGAGRPYDADVDESVEDSLAVVLRDARLNARVGGVAVVPGGVIERRVPAATRDSLRYGVGTWEADSLGNHRAVLHVDMAQDAVIATIPWRRRDPSPEKVNVVVIDATTQKRVLNVARLAISREAGRYVFQAPSAGDYYFYYLPYTGTFKSNYPKISYRVVEETADREWLARTGFRSIGVGVVQQVTRQMLPDATMVGFDAVNAFSAFTPMEYIATSAEKKVLVSKHADAPFLAFAEDRSRSIRMTEDIPQLWADRGAFQPVTAKADRGEFLSFQVGIWAHKRSLDSLRYTVSALQRVGGAGTIPASAITALNLEGVDWSGHRFTRALHVDSGAVQALWFGVDVPTSAAAGDYRGRLTILAAGGARREIPIAFQVTQTVAVNHGDDAPANLTRLRWLSSQLAVDDSVVKPYTPLMVRGSTISLLGRTFTFGADAMPARITSSFTANNTGVNGTPREILAAPVRLRVQGLDGEELRWSGQAPVITKRSPGTVAWQGTQRAGALTLRTQATLEFDGTAEYTVALLAKTGTTVSNVTLELPYQADAAKYMMGLGQKGGFRPERFHWNWEVTTKNQDAAWLGDVNAGMQFTLKDHQYVRPLNTNFYLSKPLIAPRSWANGGKGQCDIAQEGTKVVARCSSGAHTLAAGDSLRFDFRLMITPFKPLDTKGQWATRFFHAFVPVDSAAGRGANTINVHHANRVNPWINYPFIETAAMRSYIDSAHAKGLQTKIYYTVRELTNHAPELFALRSLGDEVLSHGPGGGYSWLQEHLGNDYIAAWHVPAIKDAAVVNSGVSRWHNFYIEGLKWLVEHEKIDGLYLDDVAFDRITMKRVRKVLDRGNPAALLDLHSANQYNPRDGFASSANLYLEHFPFINRLWFGEYFDYDSRPDYWLVEISGIPFGLMGEMLEKGGNPWRGMTMGMTARLPWSGDPAPLWKVWDAFGIQQSQLHGWWSGRDPVTTSNASVLASTWTKPGSAMISLGSWEERDTPVTLTIDWKALGMDPARAWIRAPEIRDFQTAGRWRGWESITVPTKKGLLLIVEER